MFWIITRVFFIGVGHVPVESVIDSTVLGATTSTIENQADSLGLCCGILSSMVREESGTRCCFAVCDSSSLVGVCLLIAFAMRYWCILFVSPS